MKVGFHAPLPPAHTGVADYAAALLKELQRHGEVAVAPSECDVRLYHIGNNQLHREIYARALREPGVVVLHDALLQHFFLGSLTREQYIEEFVYNYGAWSRNEAEVLWQERSISSQDPRYFARPMLRRIAESAHTVVVHNPAAAAIVQQHAPGARVLEIPHLLFEPEPESVGKADAFRMELGMKQGTFLFGVFGYLRESKRILPILRTFQRLRAIRSEVALLIAGEFVSSDLQRAVEPLLQQPGLYRIGHLATPQFESAAASVDCCLNLRFPQAGETSGIGMRLMGFGKPVIVTEGAEHSRLPLTACFRIQPGIAEEEELFHYMAAVSQYPELARSVGREAAHHLRRYHSLELIGNQYWKALCDSCS